MIIEFITETHQVLKGKLESWNNSQVSV